MAKYRNDRISVAGSKALIQVFRSKNTGFAYAKKYNSYVALANSISALFSQAKTIGQPRVAKGFNYGNLVRRLNSGGMTTGMIGMKSAPKRKILILKKRPITRSQSMVYHSGFEGYKPF